MQAGLMNDPSYSSRMYSLKWNTKQASPKKTAVIKMRMMTDRKGGVASRRKSRNENLPDEGVGSKDLR